MNTIKTLLADPKVRLALRAILVGVTVVVAKWVGGDNDVRAIVVAGVLAAAEIFTPLNAYVGFFKTQEQK